MCSARRNLRNSPLPIRGWRLRRLTAGERDAITRRGGLLSPRSQTRKKGTLSLATTILWIHATAGALWIGACACFVIAGLALTPGSDEHRNFVTRSAPKIDRL